MGGKHKQAQRTKNNTRPSSSGRTAELLGTSINPLIGFSAIKDATLPVLSGLPFSSTSNDELDNNIDTNFQLVLKKMNKKDATTKLKALQEFTELVSSSQPEVVKTVLVVWPRFYASLAVDTEHKVREATHIAHRAVVIKVRRELAPFLRQLAGPWFTSQYDTYSPAATAATQSFQDAFPANKISDAIVFCQEEIISYICDNITVQTPQTLCNPKTTSPEDAEAKYERLVISSLQGYTLYLNKLSKEQLQSAEEINNRIISNAKFWALSKSKVPLIRAAWFGCIVALFQYASFLLQNEIPHVTYAVFNNLNESEPIVLGAMWDAVLFIVSNITDWWNNVNVEKVVLPKLWKVLKEGGQGSAVVVYPNLLPLISHFPTVEVNSFYGNFFENMRIGMKKRTVIQSRLEFGAITKSFSECFRYITMKNNSNLDLCQSLIGSHLIPTIEWTFHEESLLTKILYSEIVILLQYWGKNKNNSEYSNYNLLLETFWRQLEEMMTSNLRQKDINVAIVNKHIDLFLTFKRNGASKQRKQKVKFSTLEHKDSNLPNENLEIFDKNTYNDELNIFVYKICSLYLKLIKENKKNEFISPLCLLMQNFESEELFKYLSINVDTENENKTLIDLHKNVFLNFLKVHCTCSESVVDIVFVLFKYLNDEDKTFVLDSLEKIKNEEHFCWCVAKALSHPLCNDVIIQKWLSTKSITKLLINIASAMLIDEISPEKSLLLKQALSPNFNGDLYISKEACQEIMLIFCNCILYPSDYPFTIDVCASFAAELASTLYTEKTLLMYGDQLVLALFSMSCNSNYDQETISTDTLWEVSTAWQDVLTLFISSNLIDFENLMWKFMKIMENEFMTNMDIDRLSEVAVDLIKCLLQNNTETKNFNYITKLVLNLPAALRNVHQNFFDLCNYARIIQGDLTWTDHCPIPENISEFSEDIKIVKYLLYNQFVMKVISSLLIKTEDIEEDGESEEQNNLFVMEIMNDIYPHVVIALHSFSLAKIFTDKYKTVKLYKKVSEIKNKIKEEYSNFLNNIKKDKLEYLLILIQSNYDTVYIVNNELIKDQTENNYIYKNLLKSNIENKLTHLQLTQIFSKHLTFDDIRDPKDKLELFILNRILFSYEDIDVQIAEALSTALNIRETNIPALLYNRDIIKCDWKDVQFVIEIARFFKTIIDKKPQHLSVQHWDFVLISLASWANSADRSKQNYRKLQILEFICAICEMYMSFYKFIKNEALLSELNQSCSNIVTEYSDIFALDVHVALINIWMYIATTEIQLSNFHMTVIPALEIIGNTVSCFEEKYLVQTSNARLPKWQSFIQTCGNLLQAPAYVLQLWGYQGLKNILPALIQLDEKAAKEDENRTYGLLSAQLGHVLTTVQEIVQTILMDFKIGEESCRIESFTDSYTFTFAYLLLWDIFLTYCQYASTDLRYQYSDWLRSGDYLKNLLNNIFRLMPTEVLQCTEGRKSNVELFTVEPSLNFSDPPTSELLEHVVCWVYTRALTHLPALVRQWWAEAEPRAANTADQVTAAHVSPVLCAHELRDVTDRRRSSGDNMRVTVHPSAREVVATYTVDEARMELVITLPVNHPLGPVHVECSNQIGGTAQWRSWVMQLTVFLTHQNGRIWDGLSLWKSNLDKKFDGIEECYICFSVLHNSTYQLPKLSCQTCRKKFHSSCLYKWFSTSNKSTCPICRNLF